MLPPHTETLPDHQAIDAVSDDTAVQLMLDGQAAAIAAVRGCASALVDASKMMSGAVQAGGTLIYAAAGSSGLMALADACELPGTFGVAAGRIRIHMAGGVPADGIMPGNVEDDTGSADQIAATKNDVIIILSASGSTPYALAAAKQAKLVGARVIGIANNPDTPLLAQSDIAIYLATPPEIIAGSTRLAAGTAQKAALNVMSTLMGVQLGHVYQGMMVNVVADNAKLRHRAAGIIRIVAGVTLAQAQAALDTADGHVKRAILIATGLSPSTAAELLHKNGGHLGPRLSKSETI